MKKLLICPACGRKRKPLHEIKARFKDDEEMLEQFGDPYHIDCVPYHKENMLDVTQFPVIAKRSYHLLQRKRYNKAMIRRLQRQFKEKYNKPGLLQEVT